jgi:CRP/FNR family transcriptional regulator, cyclic AMP receptor protein
MRNACPRLRSTMQLSCVCHAIEINRDRALNSICQDPSMTVVEGIGYSAAGLGVIMLAMQTMIPLRLTGIANNITSITFALLAGVYPMAIQHIVLLPLNIYRLVQMLKLIKQVKAASAGDLTIEWLKPYMTKQAVRAGDILFRKGEEAERMYFIISGRFHLNEIDVDLMPGAVVGELGMLAPNRQRTQTLACVQDGEVLEIAYERIEEIYYQNPTFGFYFLRLSAGRLFENIERLEQTLAARDEEINRLRSPRISANS